MIFLYLLMTVFAFVLTGAYLYPLTVQLTYKDKAVRACWLPRLCGGYGKPRLIERDRQQQGGQEQRRLSPHLVLRLIRRWRHVIHLRQCDFLFLPGYGCLQCIIEARAGDIIRISAAEKLRGHGQRRKKHGRRV